MIRRWLVLFSLMCGARADAQAARDPALWWTWPTRDLATRFLPPDDAAAIVDHQIVKGFGGGFEAIRLFQRPDSLGRGLCRRKGWYITLDAIKGARTGEPSPPPSPSLQLALARDCRAVPADGWAWVNQPQFEARAAATLRWLADTQAHLRSSRSAKVAVTCVDDMKADACAAGPRATFAAIPLDRIYLIDPPSSFGGSTEWAFSVMPNGPGRLYYQVKVQSSDGSIAIVHEAPAPF